MMAELILSCAPWDVFFQVTDSAGNYNKYLLDIDKVVRFPVTFAVKTEKSKEDVEMKLNKYIDKKSGGMKVIQERYKNAIEEIITINELKEWLSHLDSASINDVLEDIVRYYKLELNINEI